MYDVRSLFPSVKLHHMNKLFRLTYNICTTSPTDRLYHKFVGGIVACRKKTAGGESAARFSLYVQYPATNDFVQLVRWWQDH